MQEPPSGAGDGINCDQQTTTQIRLIWVIPVRIPRLLLQRSESRPAPDRYRGAGKYG
jgi:hypothetical protein